MKTWIVCAALLALPLAARAQVCNPACADQPAQCCAQPEADTFLAEQCTGPTSDTVHFRVTNGTAWIDHRTPAQFSVAGLQGTVKLGDALPVTFDVTIGTSTASARFQIIDSLATPLVVIGQCVTTGGNKYNGLPTTISDHGRGLTVSGRNPLFCRATGFPDLLCFGVKGQVGEPFEAGAFCDPDRVEFLCGKVTNEH